MKVDLSLPKREESDRPGAVAERVGLELDWFQAEGSQQGDCLLGGCYLSDISPQLQS